jgi:replicative DNA helicase
MIAVNHEPAAAYDDTAERHVIAGLLLFPSQFAQVRDLVSPEEFSGFNGIVFAAICETSRDGALADVGTIISHLKRSAPHDEPRDSWVVFFQDMFDPQLWGVNAPYHARVVRNLAKKRKAQELVDAMGAALSDRFSSPLEAMNELDSLWREAAIGDLANADSSLPTLGQAGQSILDFVHGRGDPVSPISTTLADLDRALNGGLFPGRFTVLAAETGKGKSTLALQIARAAAKVGAVLYVSVEMGRRELLERLVSSEANVAYSVLQTGALTDDGVHRTEKAIAKLTALPIFVPEQAAPTAEEISSWARRYRDTDDLRLVVVDYLQILKISKGREKDTREQQVGQSAIVMKQIAAELNVPVLAMSQLNEGGNVRDSRAIEHHADTLLVIEPDEKPPAGDGLVDVTIHVRKGRNTGRSATTVAWEPRFVRFKNAAARNFNPDDYPR